VQHPVLQRIAQHFRYTATRIHCRNLNSSSSQEGWTARPLFIGNKRDRYPILNICSPKGREARAALAASCFLCYCIFGNVFTLGISKALPQSRVPSFVIPNVYLEIYLCYGYCTFVKAAALSPEETHASVLRRKVSFDELSSESI